MTTFTRTIFCGKVWLLMNINGLFHTLVRNRNWYRPTWEILITDRYPLHCGGVLMYQSRWKTSLACWLYWVVVDVWLCHPHPRGTMPHVHNGCVYVIPSSSWRGVSVGYSRARRAISWTNNRQASGSVQLRSASLQL